MDDTYRHSWAPPPEEVRDPNTLRVSVHAKSNLSRRRFSGHRIGAYGLFGWGLGGCFRYWGCGFSNQDDQMRAAAIVKAVDLVGASERPNVRLEVTVRGLRQILDLAAKSGGTTKDGQPFQAYDLYKQVIDLEAARRLRLQNPTKPQMKSREYRAAKEQAELGFERAEFFGDRMAEACSSDVDHFIYATSENPDPHGLWEAFVRSSKQQSSKDSTQ